VWLTSKHVSDVRRQATVLYIDKYPLNQWGIRTAGYFDLDFLPRGSYVNVIGHTQTGNASWYNLNTTRNYNDITGFSFYHTYTTIYFRLAKFKYELILNLLWLCEIVQYVNQINSLNDSRKYFYFFLICL